MVNCTPREISEKYDRFARWYDVVEGLPDLLGVKKLRESLFRRASGKVLEVAVGTGKNLPHYDRAFRIIGVDISREMLSVARRRAAKLPIDVSCLPADASALPFSDHSFDTVVSSLTTCTFPHPVNALREMARVCRPEGKILLLEHGRSDRRWLARWQDKRADRHAQQLACHWNREPLELVRQAGLRVTDARRVFLGIFHQIEIGR
jgi:ubiquinone/menaquinone biosynthesis C-methylase UbiE